MRRGQDGKTALWCKDGELFIIVRPHTQILRLAHTLQPVAGQVRIPKDAGLFSACYAAVASGCIGDAWAGDHRTCPCAEGNFVIVIRGDSLGGGLGRGETVLVQNELPFACALLLLIEVLLPACLCAGAGQVAN